MSVSNLQKSQLAKAMSEMLYELCQGHIDIISKKGSRLKRLSKNFSEKVQSDIQALIIQVEIQKDYIPQNGITEDVKRLADRIIKDLKL